MSSAAANSSVAIPDEPAPVVTPAVTPAVVTVNPSTVPMSAPTAQHTATVAAPTTLPTCSTILQPASSGFLESNMPSIANVACNCLADKNTFLHGLELSSWCLNLLKEACECPRDKLVDMLHTMNADNIISGCKNEMRMQLRTLLCERNGAALVAPSVNAASTSSSIALSSDGAGSTEAQPPKKPKVTPTAAKSKHSAGIVEALSTHTQVSLTFTTPPSHSSPSTLPTMGSSAHFSPAAPSSALSRPAPTTSFMSTIMPLHSWDCQGRKIDVAEMREKMKTYSISANTYLFRQSEVLAAREGHRKCVRFLLKQSRPFVQSEEHRKQMFEILSRFESTRTMELGLQLLDRLVDRRRLVLELCEELVCRNRPIQLMYVLDRLGLHCRIQSNERLGRHLEAQHHDTRRTAVVKKQPACLFVLLRHGVVKKSVKNQPTDPEKVLNCSLLPAWVRTAGVYQEAEERVLKIIHMFGNNLWEEDSNGILLVDRLVRFPAHNHQPWQQMIRSALEAKMREMMAAPRSLQSCSRLAIIKALGPVHVDKLDHLRDLLPTALIDYLAFKDETEWELLNSANLQEPESDSSEDEDFEKMLDDIWKRLKGHTIRWVPRRRK